MRIEETRTFPVSAKEAFDYITDPRTLELWVAGLMLLLEENQPGEYRKINTDVPGIGTVTQQWFFTATEDDRVTLRVVYDTAEPTTFFGKIIDRTVVPKAVQRDLKATMSNLEEIFTLGFTE
jgi:hypothetical protein